MPSEKRRAIRMDVLNDLHRASKLDRSKRRTFPVSVEFDDPETFFALEYLAEKKLVYFKQTHPDYYVAKITPLGKSYLELEHGSRKEAACR
ncbi:hypothetical protein [Paenibacillus sp.]|uniref:hypothetical protein n=1 Tax=Paenibacillus sp. TaxID=58172 RepID=UPI0028119DD6|nr:hypothetical protein [Paenibacillus sp.]